MHTKEQSVLRGSVWLMGSALLAKLLGAVFRIPLTALLGGTGMGYYSCAYGLFLPVFALSVTGMNTAVAALTAQALAQGRRADAARIAAAGGEIVMPGSKLDYNNMTAALNDGTLTREQLEINATRLIKVIRSLA